MAKIMLLDIDSKIPNLALMKLSAYHKAQGDEVFLDFPLMPTDKTYASCLYQKNKDKIPIVAIKGGIGVDPKISLPSEVERMKPNYSLYPNIDFSLGYTYRHCPRKCPFCLVWQMSINKDKEHHSIWEFHDSRFKKIMLLDNNLFASPNWRQTFEEIWDADLKVMEHGFDIRLLDEEKAQALAKTKFVGQIHFAFDQPEEETAVRQGITLLKNAGVNLIKVTFYVLCGFDTTPRQDIDRVRILRELGTLPFVMKFHNRSDGLNKFARLASRPAATKRIDWAKYPEWN